MGGEWVFWSVCSSFPLGLPALSPESGSEGTVVGSVGGRAAALALSPFWQLRRSEEFLAQCVFCRDVGQTT